MTLKEAYEIFYGRTNHKITEKFIVSNKTFDDIRTRYFELIKENNLNTTEGKDKELEKINKAWEKLRGIHKKKTINKKKNNSISVEKEYTRSELINQAKMFKKIKLMEQVKKALKTTERYYVSIKRSPNIKTVYNIKEKYKKFLETSRLAQEEIKKTYNSIINYTKKANCKDSELNKMIKAFAGKDYVLLETKDLQKRINQETKRLQLEKIIYTNQKSYILNLKNMLIEIISNSVKLNSLIMYMNLSNKAEEGINFLSSKAEISQKVEVYKEYLELRDDYLKKKKYWENYSQIIKKELIHKKEADINSEYIEKLENKIASIIPEEYMYLLLSKDELSDLSDDNFLISKSDYKTHNRDINKAWNNIFATAKEDILEYKNVINQINYLMIYYGREKVIEKKNSSIKENDDLEEGTINKYHYYRSTSLICEKECIDLFQEIFLNYYLGYKKCKLPEEIINDYESLKGYTSNDQVDQIYSKFLKKYDEITKSYTEETQSIFSLKDKNMTNTANLNLALSIKNYLNELNKINFELPERIKLELQKGIGNMSNLELYNLYQDIYNSHHFGNFVEFPINKK